MSLTIRLGTVRTFILPTAISLALFLSAFYLPVIGLFVSIFSPLPVFFVYLQHGRGMGLAVLLALTLLVAVLFSPRIGLIFSVEYGVVAVAMAETIRRRFPMEWTVVLGVAASALLMGMGMLLLFLERGFSPWAILQRQVELHLQRTIQTYQELGMPSSSLELLTQQTSRLAEVLIQALPAMVVAGATLAILANYLLARFIGRRFGLVGDLLGGSSASWSLPDAAIWVFIAGGLLMVLPWPGGWVVGLNLLIVMVLGYLLQGLAIVHALFQRWQLSGLFRGLGYLLLVVQPLLLGLITLVGLFDLWVDFRRIRKGEMGGQA